MADNSTIVQIAPYGDLRLVVGPEEQETEAEGEAKAQGEGEVKGKDEAEGEGEEGGEDESVPGIRTYVVSSVVLSLASPVWNAMFGPHGHFMEADTSAGSREIRLAEDDPEALLIILRIAHLQFRQLPTALDFKELLRLAIICDKYDVVGLVRPWLSQWEEPLKPSAFEPGHEEWLFIAWTFGDNHTYEFLADQLVSDSTSNEVGQCFHLGKLLGDNMPPGSIG